MKSPLPAPFAGASGSQLPEGPFRIHAVSEMTGVPEPTLRAWERRYGIPTPERTASGYRLYSLRAVDQVRSMLAAAERGMSAAEAAEWVRSRTQVEARPESPVFEGTDPFPYVQSQILRMVERFDDEGFEQLLRQVMFMGPCTTLLDQLFAPTLREIGERWHRGELSVAQEHFAAQRIGKALRDLMQLSTDPSATPRIILAAFADEDHELGLLGLGLRLATWGYRPLFLGARTPPEALAIAVAKVEPGAVALSVTVAPSSDRGEELVRAYAEACGDVPWLVGGAGAKPFEPLVRSLGGLIDPASPEALKAMLGGLRAAPKRRLSRESKAKA